MEQVCCGFSARYRFRVDHTVEYEGCTDLQLFVQAQVGVPWYVLTALYLTAVVLPATQGVVCVALVALGVGLLAVGMCRLRRFVHKYVSLDQLPQCTS